MTETRIPARHIFGYRHEGTCCAHAPYVIDEDSETVANDPYPDSSGPGLFKVLIDGVLHISDRYIAIESELVDLSDLNVGDYSSVSHDRDAEALDHEPVDALFHPATAGRAIACGLEYRATHTLNDQGAMIAALTLDGVQVGIHQTSYAGANLADVKKVVEVAKAMHAAESPDPCDLELTDVADVLSAAGVITHVWPSAMTLTTTGARTAKGVRHG